MVSSSAASTANRKAPSSRSYDQEELEELAPVKYSEAELLNHGWDGGTLPAWDKTYFS